MTEVVCVCENLGVCLLEVSVSMVVCVNVKSVGI